MANHMDKYDDAITFLRDQDAGQGSYFEECAYLIEELLGQLHEAKSVKTRVTSKELAATTRGAKSWFYRNGSFSPAIDSKE